MTSGQRHQRRLQPRPEPADADPRRQRSAGACATVPTAQLMRAVLGPDHADRRQLRDLVATEPPLRTPLLGGELTTAPTTRIREVIDDLIDLILRPQHATRTAMPRLPASLALLALPAHQLLRPRPRLRPPLRPRLRRIHRRRPGTRTGVLTRRSLQTTQPLLQLLHPRGEIENELDTNLAARVINRLRLRTLHARKIRCNKQESSPQAPTAERLPKPADLQVDQPDSRARHSDCHAEGRGFESLQPLSGKPR